MQDRCLWKEVCEEGATREFFYIGNNILVIRRNNADNIHYICHDNLGSVVRIVDEYGTVVYSASYDAWGSRSVSLNTIGFMRGYTAHEHLDEFGLINMNGRLYDPLLGRFLSPDPYVQEMENSQNFNRFSYCLNNPLKYNDPSGEFFFFVAFNAIINTIQNVAKHGLNISQYDYTQTVNAWKIDMGMFKGGFWRVVGKWTWGLYNSYIGNNIAHVYNTVGKVNKVTYFDGAMALDGPTGNSTKAFTIGHVIFGPNNFKADWRDNLFVHEYGHYIQSQIWGPTYIPVIGIPSILSATCTSSWSGMAHKERWFEVDASKHGANYFEKHYGKENRENDSDDYFDKKYFYENRYTPYINPRTNLYEQDGLFKNKTKKTVLWDFLI